MRQAFRAAKPAFTLGEPTCPVSAPQSHMEPRQKLYVFPRATAPTAIQIARTQLLCLIVNRVATAPGAGRYDEWDYDGNIPTVPPRPGTPDGIAFNKTLPFAGP
jgi:hypothetical protein